MVKELHLSRKVTVGLACRELRVGRSGYYAWSRRKPSSRARANQKLVPTITEIFAKSRKSYGSPRVTEKLKAKGIKCNEKRVARLMNEQGIAAIQKKRFKVVTTDSNHDLPIAPRVFEAEHATEVLTGPNQAWAGDITYIPTEEGWLFLAVYLDVFTRKIVGFSGADNMRVGLVLDALEMALGRQSFERDQLLGHTDRGSQYAADEYRERLRDAGIVASMSRRGNCYDNAFVESFFHSLKVEFIYQRVFKTRDEAMKAIFEWIEVWYNRERLHSSIGYKTPVEFEEMALAS